MGLGITWVAALIIAFIGVVSRWEAIGKPRRQFGAFYSENRKQAQLECAHLQPRYQAEHIRKCLVVLLTSLLQKNDPSFGEFVAYVSFRVEMRFAHLKTH